MGTPLKALGADISLSEYEVKAAMLFNFAKFAEWPPHVWKDAATPLTICISGNNPFGESLGKLTEMQTYLGHPVRVQKFVLPGGADICQILFIARNESRRIGDVLKSVEGKPVLTVSDIDHFTREGGMLGFVLVDNRVRFTVNPARTSKAGILISSKLLQLAVAVEAGGAN